MANADGSGVKVLRKGTKTKAPGVLAIAPGNNRIAMELEDSTKDSGPSTIALMNVDGSGYRVLAQSKSTEMVSQLGWNATGTKLLVSLENEDHDTSYLATLDPSAAHPALVKLSGSVGLDSGSFSPLSDGTVVASDSSGSILTLTGGHTTLVLSGGEAGGFGDPVFSPDGGSIAFSAFALSGTAFVSRIELISADGQVGPTVLAGSGLNLWPFWSSDGESVAYTSLSASGNSSKAYRVAADGGSAPAAIPFPAGKIYIPFDQAAPDTTAPSAPTSLHVSLNGAHPVVSWKWPTDVDVSKVIVRRLAGTVAPATPTDGSPVYTGHALTTTDAVTAGETYTYAAWAVDGAGNVSGPSVGQDVRCAAGAGHQDAAAGLVDQPRYDVPRELGAGDREPGGHALHRAVGGCRRDVGDLAVRGHHDVREVRPGQRAGPSRLLARRTRSAPLSPTPMATPASSRRRRSWSSRTTAPPRPRAAGAACTPRPRGSARPGPRRTPTPR